MNRNLTDSDYLALGYIINDTRRLRMFALMGCYVRLTAAGYIKNPEGEVIWATPEGISAYHA